MTAPADRFRHLLRLAAGSSTDAEAEAALRPAVRAIRSGAVDLAAIAGDPAELAALRKAYAELLAVAEQNRVAYASLQADRNRAVQDAYDRGLLEGAQECLRRVRDATAQERRDTIMRDAVAQFRAVPDLRDLTPAGASGRAHWRDLCACGGARVDHVGGSCVPRGCHEFRLYQSHPR